MKAKISYILFMFLLVGLVSCTDSLITAEAPEPVISADSGSDVQEFIVNLPEIEEEAEAADTRTTFTFPDGGGFTTSWAKGDTLGIFPGSGGQVEFPISGTGSSASFNGGGWGLKTSSTYAAYYPFSKANYYQTSKTIVLDYTGQVQRYNNVHDHLGRYDFLASKNPVTPSGGSVTIEMDRLNALLMLELTVPVSDTYTEIELFTDNTPFVTKAELDISASRPLLNIKETSNVIRLKLGNAYVSQGNVLTAYMMVYPGREVNPRVVLHGEKGDYQGTLNKKMTLTANMKYTRQATMEEGLRLTNANLIAAAEENEGVDFTDYKDDETGYVDINAARDMLEKVTSIDVSGKYDQKVCDEIGFFKNLQTLDCGNNYIAHLDVSKNRLLKKLICNNNNLTTLDLKENANLTDLNVYYNNLTSLDVSHNPKLQVLYCNGNQLTSLDVSYNASLLELDCGRNYLISLDVTHNPWLVKLWCSRNQLTSLDLSNNGRLSELYCDNNKFKSMDFSKNIYLKVLQCQYNKLTSLSLSNNTNLEELNCAGNDLTGLNVTSLVQKKLTKVDVSYCTKLTTIYAGGTASKIGSLKTLTLSDCTALDYLDCSYNQLSSLNLNSATALMYLYSHDNLMSTLNISKCTSLSLNHVYCGCQWTNNNRTTNKTLTLTISSSNTGTLGSLQGSNYMVQYSN